MLNRWLKGFEKPVTYLLLFLLPTQFALHFWPNWAFVFGIRVDFLAPSIYVSDILVIILFAINLVLDWKSSLKFLIKYKIYSVPFLLFATLNIIFSISPPESIYKWVKIVEYLFLAYYFFKQKILSFQSIITTLLFSSSAFSLLGIMQFIKGATLGGPLYFLGERTFSLSTPGIALVTINGLEHLRSYSTFSHPNSLAGFLGIVIILLFMNGLIEKNILKIIALIITSTCFVLTFSLSAHIGLLVVIILSVIFKKRKKINNVVYSVVLLSITISLLLPIISPLLLKSFSLLSQNLSQRLDLAQVAGKLISQKFLLGSGLGTFIIASKVLQPVHNIFLLIIVETGIFGLIISIYILLKIVIKNPLAFIFVIITGLTDHYWFTLQQNLLLLSILFGISIKMTQWKKH